MKQLLTCLVYVYALVLVPNSVAAQTIWDYYYLGEANNWDASAAEDLKYHFGQTSSTTDVITWTLTLSGSQLDCVKDGNAYFAVHVKTDATGEGNIFRMGPDNNDEDITQGSGSVSKNSNSFLLRNVDQNALYKLTFVRSLSGSSTVGFNRRVAQSEQSCGYLNAAIANLLKYHGNIRGDITRVLEFYFLPQFGIRYSKTT